jgi:predicted nuclease of restriction endonuclease-like (RecB) superfamily
MSERATEIELSAFEAGIEYAKSGDILNDARTIIDAAQGFARQAVNIALVRRNWLLGRRIAEGELKGEDRADYGAKVIKKLAKKLTEEYGKGFSRTNLYQFKQFYEMFPEIAQTAFGQFASLLTWSHYATMLRVFDKDARDWYANEAASQNWSVRILARNIDTQYYYRLLMSQDKAPVVREMEEKTSEYQMNRLEFVKNPVIAEFLGFPQDKGFVETELEQAILTNLQQFLMEMGKGYAFVARQQHIRTELDDYYIDLVFYNYILKCFVLIDLKTTKVTHQDVGQMDMYVRMYDDLKRGGGDNPTLGIVLCAETDADIARYSVLHGNEHIFAAKYELYLPTEEQLRAEIEVQKAVFEAQHSENGDD